MKHDITLDINGSVFFDGAQIAIIFGDHAGETAKFRCGLIGDNHPAARKLYNNRFNSRTWHSFIAAQNDVREKLAEIGSGDASANATGAAELQKAIDGVQQGFATAVGFLEDCTDHSAADQAAFIASAEAAATDAMAAMPALIALAKKQAASE